MARVSFPKEKMSKIVMDDLKAAAHYAADKGIMAALVTTRAKIKGAGLGRLENAVAATSSLKKRQTTGRAWGALFARGDPDWRGNQAISIYSAGGTIAPVGQNQWLWIATRNIPSRAGRQRMTPALYRAHGLEGSLGKLTFLQLSSNRAVYLIRKKVTVSRRTGRAKPFGGRVPRGSDLKKQVVAFVGIKVTHRAQRFDQEAIMRAEQARLGTYIEEYQARRAR